MQPMPKELQQVLFEKPIPGQSLTNAVDQKYLEEIVGLI